MPDNPRFLLGYGERLTGHVSAPAGNAPPGPAYSFEEAIERLGPQVAALTDAFAALPPEACPENEAVGTLVLHPQSLAKSYHPQKLLNVYNLRQVGSRPVEVHPEKWTKKDEPQLSPSTEIYVAGKRESFAQWAQDFEHEPLRIHEAIQRLESIEAPNSELRLRNIAQAQPSSHGLLVEVVLHAGATDEYIVDAFEAYARTLGIGSDLDRRLFAGGLCFVPVEASAGQLAALARFSFLRAARPLSRMRNIGTIERVVSSPGAQLCPLPTEGPLNPDLRVAVFDGGLPSTHHLSPWVAHIDAPGVGQPLPELLQHGHAVTSAQLFGSLEPGSVPTRPAASVDHYRVLDDKSSEDPYELYDVLQRISTVLESKTYEFLNLSIGPYTPIEDDDVHPWTAVLDTYLSDGQALASIAVGNNGSPHVDPAERRIQVPADCVNGFALGAADSSKDGWSRSPYSAVGPGRAPGLVKPDVLEFGGSAREPFMVYDSSRQHHVSSTQGTSFASPAALRRAVTIRTHFGDRLSPLALKALLIHAAHATTEPRAEVGWGRIPTSLDDIMVCGDGQVRVVYQGQLTPGKYLRAQIPTPPESLNGRVRMSATFTYATSIDPQDPGSYTRSGLGVTFRPHSQKFAKEDAVDAKPASFFKKSAYDTEGTLRRDAQQWETVLHREQGFLGSSLHDPVFDVHYNARTGGGEAQHPERIRYALVVTIESPKTPDLYDHVLRTFAGRLEALQPVIELPIQI